jgi:hypothetical protein
VVTSVVSADDGVGDNRRGQEERQILSEGTHVDGARRHMRHLLSTAVLAAACLPGAASAQDSVRAPAVVIRAEVSAREVTFVKQPSLRVILANGTVDSIRVIERRNLPDPVQPGVTYRDVYVAVEILGRLNAECLSARITRQAVAACGAPRDTTSQRRP